MSLQLRWPLGFVVALALVVLPATAGADVTDKIEPGLRHAAVAAAMGGPVTEVRTSTGQTVGGTVVVAVTGSGNLHQAVEAHGGVVLSTRDELVVAEMPTRRLLGLANEPSVEFVSSIPTPFSESLSEGIIGQGAANWHAAGFDGSGIRVLVVDSGFGGIDQAQATGLLGNIKGSGVGPSCAPGGSIVGPNPQDRHGTAVAEVVYGMAPGVEMYLFRTCSPFDYDAVGWFIEANDIDIVNQSLAYFNTGSLDGRDPLGLFGSIDTVTESGTLWFNSAGNYRQRHWRGQWSGSGDTLVFPTGDPYIEMFLPANAAVFLRWDDWSHPVAGWCRRGACGSELNFDLFLLHASGNVIAQSTMVQEPGQPWMPIEAVYAPTAGTYRIVIRDKTSPGTTVPASMNFDLFVPWSDLPSNVRVPSGSLNDLSTMDPVIAVGAVACSNGQIRAYSSQGPTADGRNKPDLAAMDGVSTGVFGPSCPNGFQGTSASAPHAAGAAALVMQATGARGDEARTIITSLTVGGGAINRYGAGNLHLGSPPSGECNGLAATIIAFPGQRVVHGTSGPDVIVGNSRNNTIYGYAGDDTICAGAGNDTVQGGPGDDWIWGGPGHDVLRGGPGNDTILGGSGNDRIYGGRGRDSLHGGLGNDVIRGGRGHDELVGGRGDDILRGGRGNDRLFGGPGDDVLRGGPGNDVLRGGQGFDTLIGGTGTDTCLGGQVLRQCDQ